MKSNCAGLADAPLTVSKYLKLSPMAPIDSRGRQTLNRPAVLVVAGRVLIFSQANSANAPVGIIVRA